MFKNKYGEIRSGWKILLTMLLMCAMVMMVSTIISIVIGIVLAVKGVAMDANKISELQNSKLLMNILFIAQNTLTIAAVLIMAKAFEKRAFSFIGLTSIKKGWKEFLVGLALGGVTITVVAIILLAVGDVKLANDITKPNISSELLIGAVVFILVGFGEEILGRGYCMSVLKQTRNKYAILIVSSAIFAAMHLGNNGISILPLINLFLAGIVFGYMFMKSKNIWMPIGFHITWNYFQGYVWGFEVSGNNVQGLYQIQKISDNIINGGAFGPEGGLIVTVILILTLVFVGLYYRDRKIEDFLEK